MKADDYPNRDLTDRLIGCAYQVSNTLGAGFLDKVYENALAHEIRKAGLILLQQHQITVKYDGIIVGEYVADLLVENTVLIELKSQRIIGNIEAAQCLNYLRATGLSLCLLMNFGASRVEIRRIIRSR